jgi:hypothetical protein
MFFSRFFLLSFDFLKAKDVFLSSSAAKPNEENRNFIFDSDENRSFVTLFLVLLFFFPSRFLFSF